MGVVCVWKAGAIVLSSLLARIVANLTLLPIVPETAQGMASAITAPASVPMAGEERIAATQPLAWTRAISVVFAQKASAIVPQGSQEPHASRGAHGKGLCVLGTALVEECALTRSVSVFKGTQVLIVQWRLLVPMVVLIMVFAMMDVAFVRWDGHSMIALWQFSPWVVSRIVPIKEFASRGCVLAMLASLVRTAVM